jgi:hypothetical protein
MLTDVFAQADTLMKHHNHQNGPDIAQAQQAVSQVGPPENAAEFAARLPQALRVSSTTQQGIPKLQLSIVNMFEAQKERNKERAGKECDGAGAMEGVTTQLAH